MGVWRAAATSARVRPCESAVAEDSLEVVVRELCTDASPASVFGVLETPNDLHSQRLWSTHSARAMRGTGAIAVLAGLEHSD